MYGTSRHAPHTTDQISPSNTIVRTPDIGHISREDNAQRLVVVPSQSQPLSRHIPIPSRIFCLPLAALDLSIRLFLVFQRAGVLTVGQVLELEQEDFELLKLGEKSLQEVVRQVQALDVLEPVQCLPEEELVPAEPSTMLSDPEALTGTPSDGAGVNDALDNAIELKGHRYAWTVLVNEDGWVKKEQWYINIAPGTFPYLPGTLIEHEEQYYVLESAGSSMLRVSLFQFLLDGEAPDEEELPEEGAQSGISFQLPAATSARKTCYEVNASCLPLKYRDRISRRQRTCWIETPEPCSIRPGYFSTRIGNTPDQLQSKRPVFLTKEEASLLAPVSSMPTTIIKVAPAFLLPEDIQQVICSDVSRLGDPWESERQAPSLRQPAGDNGNPSDRPVRVHIPRHLVRMAIKQLNLSLPLARRLELAGITRVWQLLEMQEDAFRALAIGASGMQEIARRLEEIHALPSKETMVYGECYLHITENTYTDEQKDTWRMVYVSNFPDCLTGWRSGQIYTVWLLEQHVSMAMNWDRSLLSLDTHTLRVRVNKHIREQGAIAPPLRMPKRKREPEELELSASKNIPIRLDAVDGLLDTLPPGEETRRYRDRDGFLFGLQQEEWLALGRRVAEWKREQHAIAGKHREAFAMERVAACIKQVEDWYAGLTSKPRILGLCVDVAEEEILCSRTLTIREKGKRARMETRQWAEMVNKPVGYLLVIGAPPWVTWPEGWAQKPGEVRQIA